MHSDTIVYLILSLIYVTQPEPLRIIHLGDAELNMYAN